MIDKGELNYSKIVNDLWRFRRFSAGGNEGFSDFDQPGHFYFKILFDFDDRGENANGLLGLQNINFNMNEAMFMGNAPIDQNMKPNVESIRGEKDKYPVYADTAFNFLLLNNEIQRASYLRQFIVLLSEINTNSPWYWKSISGLDALLERKFFTEPKLGEERPKITIKCLPDAYDTRIGTLLDLYRAICYSYSQKKEILPANLRKFDMSIFIFHTPVVNMHDIHGPQMLNGKTGNKDSKLYSTTGDFGSDTYIGFYPRKSEKHFTSNKLIELRNCEIEISSSKSAYGELSNEEGFGMEYTIEISCDDAYENRYNEFVMRNIGDYLYHDLTSKLNNDPGDIVVGSQENLDKYIDRFQYAGAKDEDEERDLSSINDLKNTLSKKSSLLGVAKDQFDQFTDDVSRLGQNVIGATMNSLTKPAESFIRGKLLGNIYGFNLSDVNKLSNPVSAIRKEVEKNFPSGSNVGKKLPGSLSFEEKRASLLSRVNQGKNIYHNL